MTQVLHSNYIYSYNTNGNNCTIVAKKGMFSNICEIKILYLCLPYISRKRNEKESDKSFLSEKLEA